VLTSAEERATWLSASVMKDAESFSTSSPIGQSQGHYGHGPRDLAGYRSTITHFVSSMALPVPLWIAPDTSRKNPEIRLSGYSLRKERKFRERKWPDAYLPKIYDAAVSTA
jgi:hypothetical protein